jgi:uncharacterized membrane protein (UPF0127 family)
LLFIEIADTPEERQLGLMNRIFIPELSGMLFVFQQPGQYNFWMKNTLIPLDMIWIDAQTKSLTSSKQHRVPQIPALLIIHNEYLPMS